MKKFSLILLSVCLLTLTDYAQQEGWFFQNPNWGSFGAQDVCFVDENTGWIDSFLGTVMKTTDGGAHFYKQDLNTEDTFLGICFPSPNVGYIFGAGGSLYKTVDAGNNWVKKPNSIGQYLNKGYFFDENNGWICGYNGTVVKTNDGGTTWQNSVTGTTSILNSIHFYDQNNGIVAGWNNTLLKTEDGGLNWVSIAPAGNNTFYSVYYASLDTIFAGGYGLLRSVDGGLNWETILSPSIKSLKFFTGGTTGFAVGMGVFKTTDGGDTWVTLIEYNLIGGNLNAASYISNTHIFCAGDNGIYGTAFIATSNAGLSWDNYTSTLFFNGTISRIYFQSPEKGFVTGVFYDDGVYMTTNGGTTWSYIPISMNSTQTDIKFFDDNIGIAVGTGYSIARTTDGGYSWQNIDLQGGTSGFGELSLPEYPYGYAFGSKVISKTIDGGLTWEPLNVPDLFYNTGYFVSKDTGWTAGNGFIKKTIDGGQNWVNLYSSGGYFTSIFFATPDSGWACGSGKNVGRTTDGGITWIPVLTGATGTNVVLYQLFFLNSKEGFVAGTGGYLGYTNDGGVTWVKQNANIGQPITSLFFIDSQTGWISGYDGFIKKTNNGGIITSVDEIPYLKNKGSAIVLNQNYPNPFTHFTKISWKLELDNRVVLKVYDFTGREIRTLIDEFMSAGDYQVTFDAAHLTAGIYFYQLRIGEAVETKKMVLVR